MTDSGHGRTGFVAAHGLRDADGESLAAEAVRRAESAGVETIRLSLVDQHGILRGKTIPLGGLASAMRNGVAMTSTILLKDTSHRTVFPVWQADTGFSDTLGQGALTGAGDVVMVPDPATFKVLPWSPTTGALLCDVYLPDGRPLPFSTRHILDEALGRLHQRGLDIVTGLEVEFHVYAVENPRLAHADTGMPPAPPDTSLLAHGYQYLTEDRADQLEAAIEAIRRAAQALGLPVRSMEVEFGPGQIEFTFDPLRGGGHADTMVWFRTAAKQVSRQLGLHATFMSRPAYPHAMASGWHLHQSIVDYATGANRFMPGADAAVDALSQLGQYWVAGLLRHAAETCLLSTPTVTGYKRYQPFALAPDRIQWSRDNKGAMIRALAAPGDPASRIENRIGEPAANPYLYLASQVLCGLDGLDRAEAPPPPVEAPYDADAERLPNALGAAIDRFAQSAFYRGALGDAVVDYLVRLKRAEWERYLATVSVWEQREYFSIY